MTTVYKYPLGFKDSQEIHLPKDAIPLSVQLQHGNLTLWCLVDTTLPIEVRIVDIRGTGESLSYEPGLYVGTVQVGAFVWHVFMKHQEG